VIPARQATCAGGIDSLESILGFLKSLKIRAQGSNKIFLSDTDPAGSGSWLDILWLLNTCCQMGYRCSKSSNIRKCFVDFC
jgi:hypothetical protein